MKKQLFIARPAKFYSAALLTSMLFFSGIVDAKANGFPDDDNGKTTRISYVGTKNNLVTFNVNFNNVNEEKFQLVLTNDQGDVLFRESFIDKIFNKNIYVRIEGDRSTINISLKAGKQNFNQKFEIEAHTRFVSETIVTRV